MYLCKDSGWFMTIYAIWKSILIHDNVGHIITIHDNSWKFMTTHVYSWIFIIFDDKLLQIIRNHANSR